MNLISQFYAETCGLIFHSFANSTQFMHLKNHHKQNELH